VSSVTCGITGAGNGGEGVNAEMATIASTPP
jgi:hypothetical protein